MGHPLAARFDYKESKNPAYPPEEIYGIFSSDPARQYDMREVIARVVDASKFEEYRAESGKTIVCGYARIGGWAVGIVANNKKHVTTIDPATGEKRIEFGGVKLLAAGDVEAIGRRLYLDAHTLEIGFERGVALARPIACGPFGASVGNAI